MKFRTFVTLYNDLNSTVFNDLLTRPVIRATKGDRVFGSYRAMYRNIRGVLIINLKIKGIATAKETVYHEMIHQYLDEILDIEESNPHGPIFQQYYAYFAELSDIELDYHTG